MIPDRIKELFNVKGIGKRLTGGQGNSFLFNDVVIKPVGDSGALYEMTANILRSINNPEYRLAKPIKSINDNYIEDGFIATEYHVGEHDDSRIEEALRISRIFHEDLKRFNIELPKQEDRWSKALSIIWDDYKYDIDNDDYRYCISLLESLPGSDEPKQLIHGDMAGNVLYHESLSPLIIDFSPSIAPYSFIEALIIVDHIAWGGGYVNDLNLLKPIHEYIPQIKRAILFRLLTTFFMDSDYKNCYMSEYKAYFPIWEHLLLYSEIPGSENWEILEKVDKGWSSDEKYHIKTKNGLDYLLRISGIDTFDSKKTEYEMIDQLSKNIEGVPKAFVFGKCIKGVYMLLEWIIGEDLEIALKNLSEEKQYSLGFSAGQKLKLIHDTQVDFPTYSWEKRQNEKIDKRIKMYIECPHKYDNGDVMIKYLLENRKYLKDRPLKLLHGDYHVGNMILKPDGEIGIIDFNRFDYGDPWEDFNRIVWDVDISHAFARGKINGYFNNDVPDEFFRLLALYTALNTISSLPWAIPYGEQEIMVMKNQAKVVLYQYDNFRQLVPKWYASQEK